MSDTSTHYANEPSYCKRCGYEINWCVCHTDYIDFLDDKFDREQTKLIPKRVISYINNSKPSTIPIRKNMHSLSGMKGIKLLKKIDKNV